MRDRERVNVSVKEEREMGGECVREKGGGGQGRERERDGLERERDREKET